jgi:DNA-binding beta-propeller fold protein YncE
VAGIVSDERGYFYVADRLKNAILVFDPDFRFMYQFGYIGPRPDNLFGPKYLALDSRNRLYVSQLRDQGVSVFDIIYDESEASREGLMPDIAMHGSDMGAGQQRRR